MLENLFESGKRAPDFINDIGVKWWFDKEITAWATRPDQYGTVLKDVKCYLIEEPNGIRTRIILQKGEIVYESHLVESIACALDLMKFFEQACNRGGN
jgi:hypothetical protein